MGTFKLLFDIEKINFNNVLKDYLDSRTIESYNSFIILKNIVRKGTMVIHPKPSKIHLEKFLKQNASYLLKYKDLFWEKWENNKIEVILN